LAKKAGVCAICGELQENRYEHYKGSVCKECKCLDKLEDLRTRLSKRVDGTYNRLNAFKELGLPNEAYIVADIEEYLGNVEKSLKNESIQFETFKTEIISNFERVSALETTLISANLIELTNKMPQANVITLRDEKKKIKKLAERSEKNNVELRNQNDNLKKEIGELNENREIFGNDKNVNDIHEYVINCLKLIKEIQDNGLLKIYEPYDIKFKKDEEPREFTNDINNMLEKEEKEIKICGLSLREFFTDGRKFGDKMRNAFERMARNKEFSVKVLLIDLESDWKTQREEAENKFAKDKLGTDLVQSIVWLNNTITNLEHEDKIRDKIRDNIRFYNATPDFFLFITSECVVFENYHMGAFELKKETQGGVRALGLGGHVPVFKFDSKSPMYKYLNSQFDYYFEKKIDGKPNKYHARTLGVYMQGRDSETS